jgi:hypothetical protein
MEILLSHRSVNKLWDARDQALFRAPERVVLTGPSAKEAESLMGRGSLVSPQL